MEWGCWLVLPGFCLFLRTFYTSFMTNMKWTFIIQCFPLCGCHIDPTKSIFVIRLFHFILPLFRTFHFKFELTSLYRWLNLVSGGSKILPTFLLSFKLVSDYSFLTKFYWSPIWIIWFCIYSDLRIDLFGFIEFP